jgi:secondary thiamine-phosphate synthase enzyme
MRTHRSECTTATSTTPDFVDITDEIESALAGSGIHEGRVTVFSPNESCSLLVQERESGLLADIVQTMQRLDAGPNGSRVALIGSPSIVLPAVEGRLRLGMWQRVLLVELGEPRTRSVVVQITGE